MMPPTTAPDLAVLRAAVGAVCDPELPPLTLVDLGILRSVEATDDGRVVVTITPTYSGCPAVEYIEDRIVETLELNGCHRHRIVRSLTPAWTTDWMTGEGRRKLAELGIAPPGPVAATASVPGRTLATSIDGVPVGIGSTRVRVACPRCGSDDTEQVSRFGSTACKSLHRCRTCAEPFDHFKAI